MVNNKYYFYLKELMSSNLYVSGQYDELCEKIAKDLSSICEVKRVGIFGFLHQQKELKSKFIYVRDEGYDNNPIYITVKDYPLYFEGVLSNRSFVVNDVYYDERTQEFVEEYFPHFGITSMIDNGIRFGKEFVGVICLEHVGNKIIWSEEIIGFIGSIGDILSNCYTLKKQKEIHEQLLNKSRLITIGETTTQILHDVANPLTIINGKILSAQNSLKKSDYKAVEDELIKIREVSSLVLETFSSMRSMLHGSISEKTNFNFNELIEKISPISKSNLASSKVELSVEVLSDEIQIYGDMGTLAQVILNLINNSIDAIKEFDERWIKIEFECHNDFALIKVIDSGHGIPIEQSKNIFELAYTTKKETTGTGLGLNICKKIIELHNGSLELESDYSNTCFTIRLPSFDFQNE